MTPPAGSATKALKQKFSVPGREGFVTNQQISRQFRGTGGNTLCSPNPRYRPTSGEPARRPHRG